MEVDTIAKESKDEITFEVVNIETKFKVVEEENAAKVVETTEGVVKDETQTWLTPREGEVGGNMEVEPSQVEVVARWLARPVLWLVLELEIKVLSFCLLRWGRDMEEEIASLQANLPDIEARIKGVPAAARLLPSHHDGAQGRHPAGHYWAYVHYR